MTAGKEEAFSHAELADHCEEALPRKVAVDSQPTEVGCQVHLALGRPLCLHVLLLHVEFVLMLRSVRLGNRQAALLAIIVVACTSHLVKAISRCIDFLLAGVTSNGLCLVSLSSLKHRGILCLLYFLFVIINRHDF